MLLRNSVFGLLILVSICLNSSNGEFFLEFGNQFMDVIEQPFIRAGRHFNSCALKQHSICLNRIILREHHIVDMDARVYEYVDFEPKDPNLKQLEEMVMRDDQKFVEKIFHPSSSDRVEPESLPSKEFEFIDLGGRYAHLDDSFLVVEFEQRYASYTKWFIFYNLFNFM